MSTNITTEVIFGYSLTLTEKEADALENTPFTLFPLGQTKSGKAFLYGQTLVRTENVGAVSEIDISKIDFANVETQIQEALDLVNIQVDGHAKILLSNYFW